MTKQESGGIPPINNASEVASRRETIKESERRRDEYEKDLETMKRLKEESKGDSEKVSTYEEQIKALVSKIQILDSVTDKLYKEIRELKGI